MVSDTECFGGEDPPPSPSVRRKRTTTLNERVIAAALAQGGALVTSSWWPSVAVPTPCGILHVTPIDDWIGCRFEDPVWARALLPNDRRLNRCSGKWNFNGVGTPEEIAEWFETDLVRLCKLPAVERPVPLAELPEPPPGHLRACLRDEESLVIPAIRPDRAARQAVHVRATSHRAARNLAASSWSRSSFNLRLRPSSGSSMPSLRPRAMTVTKALQQIAVLIGAPGVDVVVHAADIVDRVKAMSERAETARIVSAENAKLTARLRALGERV